MVVVLAQQLQEPEGALQDDADLPALFLDGLFILARVAVLLLIVEPYSCEAALDDGCYVLKDSVLVVSAEDVDEPELGSRAAAFQQLVGKVQQVDKQPSVLSVLLLQDGSDQLCSAIINQQLLVMFQRRGIGQALSGRWKGAGEEGDEEGL